MMAEIWNALQAEPRWLAFVGLGLDMVGAVMVAATAWMRMEVLTGYGGPGAELPGPLRWRRSLVLVGGLLLVAGFGLQMWSTYLQIRGAG